MRELPWRDPTTAAATPTAPPVGKRESGVSVYEGLERWSVCVSVKACVKGLGEWENKGQGGVRGEGKG